MAATVGRLVIDLIARTGQFERSLRRAERRVDRTARRFRSLGDRLTRGLTIPLGLAAIAAGKASVDFETAFTGVAKTVEGTTIQLDQLRKGIRAMAREIPASTEEIARVAEAAGQLGIETKNVLSFTRVMVQLGVATNLAAVDAATALARLGAIVSLPQNEFENLGSSVVALGNEFNATESEIIQMSLGIAGAAKVAGATTAEILGFATAVTSVGIEAQAGGSAISRVFITMAESVEEGGKVLRAFAKTAGVTSEQFKKNFKEDATGAVTTFIRGLNRIQREGGNVFRVFKDVGLAEIRVRKALLNLSGAGDLVTRAIADSTRAWRENIAATAEAERRFATAASKLTIMFNRLKDIAITIGNEVVPIVLDFLDSLRPIEIVLANLANAFGGMDPVLKRFVVTLGGIAIILGPVLIGLSLLAGAVAATVSPMIVALTLLGVAGTLLAQQWDTMKADLVAIWPAIKQAVALAGVAISNTFTTIFTQISVLSGVAVFLRDTWKSMATDLKTIWDEMSKDFVRGVNLMIAQVPGLQLLISVMGLLRTQSKQTTVSLKESITALATSLKTDLLESIKEVQASLAPLFIEITESSAQIATAMQDAAGKTGAALKTIETDLGGTGEKLFDFKELFISSAQEIKAAFKGMALSAARNLGAFSAKLLQGKATFEDFARVVLAELFKIAVQLAFLAAFGPIGGAFGAGLAGALAGGRANGGNVDAGRAFLVGEHGPEAFIPAVDGAIVSNQDLQGGGGGMTVVQEFNITGLDFSDEVTIKRVLSAIAEQARDGLSTEAVEAGRALQDAASLNPRRTA